MIAQATRMFFVLIPTEQSQMTNISHGKKVKKEPVVCDTKMYFQFLSLNSRAGIEVIFSDLDFKAHEPPELLIPHQEQRQLGTMLQRQENSGVDAYRHKLSRTFACMLFEKVQGHFAQMCSAGRSQRLLLSL